MNKKQYIRKITLYKIKYFFPSLTRKRTLNKLCKHDIINIYNIQLLNELNILNHDCLFHIISFL